MCVVLQERTYIFIPTFYPLDIQCMLCMLNFNLADVAMCCSRLSENIILTIE